MELGEIDVKQARELVSRLEGRRWQLEQDMKALQGRVDGLETALWLQQVVAVDGSGPAVEWESDALSRLAEKHAELQGDIERRGRQPDDWKTEAALLGMAAEYVGECFGEVDGFVGVWAWNRAFDGERAGEMWVELEPEQATLTATGFSVEVRLCTHPRDGRDGEHRWVLGEGRLQVAAGGEMQWDSSPVFDAKYDHGWMRALSEMANVQAAAAERAARSAAAEVPAPAAEGPDIDEGLSL